MVNLQGEAECLIQNHHFIIGEEIRIFIKFFQVESELICDVCQKPRGGQVITKKNKVGCFPCRRLLDAGKLKKKITDKRNNSDEKIEEAIRKMREADDVDIYE